MTKIGPTHKSQIREKGFARSDVSSRVAAVASGFAIRGGRPKVRKPRGGARTGGMPGVSFPCGFPMKSELLRHARFGQERIVFAITVVLFLVFSVTLDRFLTSANLLSLLQSVSVLGILGVGMAIVVIGRGIDLSIVATMAIPVAWVLFMMNEGVSAPVAFALGLGFSLAIGVLILLSHDFRRFARRWDLLFC
jgi:hypothetical protein